MTDAEWRHGGAGAGRPDQPGQSPWWSDGLADPWRDPDAPAVIVRRQAQPDPPPEALPAPAPLSRPRLGVVVLVAIMAALLAGAMGGTLGYVFAVRAGVGSARHTALGAGNAEPPALAQRSPGSLAEVVKRILPSVVTIRVGSSTGYTLGSGFIASADGYVITNDHVISDANGSATVVFSDSTITTARVVGSDAEADVAVLKIDRTGLPPVQFGDSDAVEVGDPVLAIGSPLALANTVTYGIVSAIDRTLQETTPGGPTRYYAAIQTDAAVNQGNSGGPLADAAGRVIGMNSMIGSLAGSAEEAGNIGLAFAIPINQAKRLAQEIIDTGRARRTVIGAVLNDSYRNINGGVQLKSVEPDGPASKAGLKGGDIVKRLDGRPLQAPSDLIALVRKYAPGSTVSVEYQRGGAADQTVQVTLVADVK